MPFRGSERRWIKIKSGQFHWLIHPKPSVIVSNIMLQCLSSASECSAAFNHHNSGWLKCSCQVENLEHPVERQEFMFFLFLNAIQKMIRVAVSLKFLPRNVRKNTVMKGSGGTSVWSVQNDLLLFAIERMNLKEAYKFTSNERCVQLWLPILKVFRQSWWYKKRENLQVYLHFVIQGSPLVEREHSWFRPSPKHK